MLVGIVDDDDGMRGSLAALLDVYGFSTRQFDSAEAVLADPAGLAGVRALVVDQFLPGLLGVDLIRRLRGSGITTILLSAQLTGKIVAEAEAAGALIALEKPLKPSTLLAVLELCS